MVIYSICTTLKDIRETMILLEITKSDNTLAIISLIVAGVAALIAFRSSNISKTTLGFTKRQYLDRQPAFDAYYIDGFRIIGKRGDSFKKLLLFHLTVRNKSEFRNTLKPDLEIEYLREDDSIARFITDHQPTLEDYLKNKELTLFPMDIEIDAKTAITKWLIFEQPDFLNKSHRIEKFSIRLTDLIGNKSFIEAVIIKDIENEN